MKKQNTFLKAVAAIGLKSAVKASGTASGFSCHQPKEPAALKKLKKYAKKSNLKQRRDEL